MSIRLQKPQSTTPGILINSIPFVGTGKIKGIGLIFVSMSNVVGRLIESIIKQEYTSMGFYILSTIRGSSTIQVVMIDAWTGLEPMKMYTIDDLLSLEDVDKIAIRRIDQRYEYKARSILANYLLDKSYKQPTLREDIRYIFGVGEPNLVDAIMSQLGTIQTSDSISVQVLERSCTLRVDPSSVIENIGSCMNQQLSSVPNVRQMQSYLASTDLLEDLLQLRPRIGIKSNVDKVDLSSSFNTFICLLQEDEFIQAVVEGIKEGRDRVKMPMSLIEEALEISSTSRVEDLNDLVGSLIQGQLSIEDLNEIIDRANSDHVEACRFLSSKITPVQVDPLNMTGIVSLTSNSESIRTQEDLKRSVEGLSSVIKGTVDDSSLIFDDLIKTMNDIREVLGMSAIRVNMSGKYKLVKSHQDVNVGMASGDEIIIPISTSTDLSMLERNDLLEILQRIDMALEVGSNLEYSLIRKKISTELSTR